MYLNSEDIGIFSETITKDLGYRSLLAIPYALLKFLPHTCCIVCPKHHALNHKLLSNVARTDNLII